MKSAYHVSINLAMKLCLKREGSQAAKKRVWKKQREN